MAGERESAEHEKPVVDVSAALGEAGHEVAELGFESLPDDGPVLRKAGDTDARPDIDDILDVATTQFPSD